MTSGSPGQNSDERGDLYEQGRKRNAAAPHRTSRQKQAQEYLQGRSPGAMQRYAPDAHADPEQGWVESEETVKELVKWREEAIY